MQPPAVEWATATHAIVVCGHAVYTGGPNLQPPIAAEQDHHWVLQSFQQAEGPYYINHIRTGVKLAAADRNSLLIFSGGQTRHPHILSEGQSYHHVASCFNFWDYPSVQSRATTEEFSRDSYDNVLFSIARFYECVGALPQKLTILSWAFKKKRFLHHTETIGWPASRFQFVGVSTPDDLQTALTKEAKTLIQFKTDATGHGAVLGKKKMARNPYRRHHGYKTTCPDLANLLDWTATTPFPKDQVPWPIS